MAEWLSGHNADALKFESLSMQIILAQMGSDWIGLDWIIQMYLIKLW